MARPLDRQSKIFGIFFFADFFKLLALSLVAFMLTIPLMKKLGPKTALTSFLISLGTLIIFFALKATLPEGFLGNLGRYLTKPRLYLPLRESNEFGEEIPR